MIRVYFDDTEINGDYILSLTQSVNPYGQSFFLGSTICRQFTVEIRNDGFDSIPEKVYLYEDDELYASLYIDSYDNCDEHYTTFNLTDVMVYLNQELEYNEGSTVKQIMNAICDNHNIHFMSDMFYLSNQQVNYSDNLTEREFVSYVSEVNGGYAYIDNNGNLCLGQYTNTPVDSIDIDMCSSYKVGPKHKFDRVYVELATATYYTPQTSENDTLYLNPDNIFLTGINAITSSDILEHILSIINGFTFYNIEIGQCPINGNLKAGQLIGAGGWGRLLNSGSDYIITSDGEKILVTDGLLIPFICTIDWKYNTKWIGGYKLDLENKTQSETQILGTNDLIRRVLIKVDRENGAITQQISQISEGLNEQTSLLQQTAESLEVRVANSETAISQEQTRLSAFETAVSITADGVRISQGTEGAYVKFTDSGMEIYVEGTKTAWAEADGFSAYELMIGDANANEKWHLHEANNGNTLMFLRR